MEVAWTSAIVSILSASVAVASVVVTLLEGRRARRNTEFLGHRDTWWQRWSWVVERALSDDDRQRSSAALMTKAVTTRAWVTADDLWVMDALDDHEARGARRTAHDARREEGATP